MSRPDPGGRAASDLTQPAPAARRRAPVSGWVGVLLTVACAVLAGLLELLLVPLFSGRVVIPAAVVFAVASNVALPRLAVAMVRSARAAVAPFVAWLVVAVFFAVVPRPEGDYISPAGGFVEYVYFGTLLGGALAGTVTVVLCAPVKPR